MTIGTSTATRRHSHKPNAHDVEGGVCPTCGQPISKALLDQITAKARARLTELEQRAMAKAKAEIAAAVAKAKQDAAAAVAKSKQDAAAALAGKVAEAINAEKARGYAERLKLTEQFQDLQRRLEKRTAHELGEEGELDVLAMLTGAFPDDEITRVPRGRNGGDLVHTIVQAGITAKLLFESKNQKVFQSKWIATARKNQIEEGAAHVVIVSVAFPAGQRELMVKDGVLVCSPSRLIAVATWLRAQTIRAHSLKLSNQQRLDKAERLYTFMCSDRVADRWSRMAQTMTRMKDALRVERTQHEKLWSDRGDQIDVLATIRETFIQDLDAIFEASQTDEADERDQNRQTD